MEIHSTLIGGEIYRIFTNDKFSKYDEDYNIFMKIRKIDLYRIEAKPPIIPFDDATKWDYDHINVYTIEVANNVGNIIASMILEAFSQMYKLKAPKVMLNSQFMDNFHQLNPKPNKVIKLWYLDEWVLKERSDKLYPTYVFWYVL